VIRFHTNNLIAGWHYYCRVALLANLAKHAGWHYYYRGSIISVKRVPGLTGEKVWENFERKNVFFSQNGQHGKIFAHFDTKDSHLAKIQK